METCIISTDDARLIIKNNQLLLEAMFDFVSYEEVTSGDDQKVVSVLFHGNNLLKSFFYLLPSGGKCVVIAEGQLGVLLCNLLKINSEGGVSQDTANRLIVERLTATATT